MATISPPTTPPATAKGLDAKLALRFMATGLLAFVAALWSLLLLNEPLLAGATLAPPVLAVIHTLALGWLTMVAVGAAYQLIPVALGVDVSYPRAARFSYAFLGLGTLSLVAGFATFSHLLMTSGGHAIGVGLALFLVNLVIMLKRVAQPSLTGRYVWVAALGLVLAAGLGLTVLTDLRLGFSGLLLIAGPPSHAALALFGWLLPFIIGVSYKLLPMFGLIHGHDERLAKWNLTLVAVAGLGLGTSRLLLPSAWPLFVGILALAMAAFSLDVGRMLKRRLRRTADAGMPWIGTGLIVLNLAIAGGAWASAGGKLPVPAARYWALLGTLVFVGGFSPIVLGYLHKIMPFLHWLNRYGDTAATAPRTADLLDARVSRFARYGYIAGLALTTAALLAGHPNCLYLSCLILALSGTAVAVNLLRVLAK